MERGIIIRLAIMVALGGMAAGCVARPAGAELVVHGTMPGDWPTQWAAPVVVPVDDKIDGSTNWTATIGIEGDDTPLHTAAQYEPANPSAGTPARMWFFCSCRPEHRGKRVTVTFTHDNSGKHSNAYVSDYTDPQLHVRAEDGKSVVSYWHGQPDPKNKYPVTSYIHPILGLDGETITDFAPKDHLHHRGVFWSWVRYERKGEAVGDWWIPRKITCEPADIASSDGPVFAAFKARHWLLNQGPSSSRDRRFLQEDFTCRVYPATSSGRAIDVEISMLALDDGVRIGGQTALNKGYGGMTFRYGPAKEVEISLNGQVGPKDVIGGRGKWADWSGIFPGPDGKPMSHRSGAAVLIHPSHPDYPPTWLTRHYGVLGVTYPGLAMLDVSRSKPLHLRYRLWIHRGNAVEGGVDAACRAYTADWKWINSRQ